MTPEQEEQFRQIAINQAQTGNQQVDPKMLEFANNIRFKQPHWKETQSEEQKQMLLQKAEEKRKRKCK
jgi:hypothetical protein